MIAALNPFDWRTVLFAKHAQHVVLIHFPIALCLAAVAFDLLGRWTHRPEFYTAAYCNFTLAAIATLPAILTGLLAWQWQLEGQHLKGILLYHLLAATASTLLIVVVWLFHYRLRKKSEVTLPAWLIALELAGVTLITITGHLGGFLSGVNTAP
jgi:uncharacterized membrane protein